MHSPLRPADRPSWANLPSGTLVDIVKLASDGREVARYPGRVQACPDQQWIAVEAAWTRPAFEIAGLHIMTGDKLIECFSDRFPFDAFAVLSPDGNLRGWYANVTWPSWMDFGERLVLYWHDLFVDLVGFSNGNYAILDEDELHDANLEAALRDMIESARDELLRRFLAREMPFRVWWE